MDFGMGRCVQDALGRDASHRPVPGMGRDGTRFQWDWDGTGPEFNGTQWDWDPNLWDASRPIFFNFFYLFFRFFLHFFRFYFLIFS